MERGGDAMARHDVLSVLDDVAVRGGRVVVLTGAGISAESGIPTFRGADGFWTVGSVNYRPEELATRRHFESDPGVVWPWYLYRIGACRDAQPNAAHRALVRAEQAVGGLFRLVTQNVDGLHTRAGSDPGRTYHIHGNLEEVRCSRSCTGATQPLPSDLRRFDKGDVLTDTDRKLLTCASCGAWLRPHVLWFDEYYNEEWFRWDSTIAAASSCDLLLVVGTSGATNLPMQMATLALRSGATVIDVNLSRSPFTELAEASGGLFLQGPAGSIVPNLVENIISAN